MQYKIYDLDQPTVPLFLFDGKAFPGPDPQVNGSINPARGYTEKSEQLVLSTRNANGETIAKKINRRVWKFDGLRWPVLTASQVRWLKQNVEHFEVQLTYYSNEHDSRITRRFYFGDFSAEPFEWDVADGLKRPTMYKDVAVNMIDMGYN